MSRFWGDGQGVGALAVAAFKWDAEAVEQSPHLLHTAPVGGDGRIEGMDFLYDLRGTQTDGLITFCWSAKQFAEGLFQ